MNSILLIDSETVVATALQATLGRFGFEVELAHSGKAAHTCLKKTHFDLILVEFDLSPRPDGEAIIEPSKSATGCWSGTGLIRELRAARITTPILVHTVLEGELYETASLDAGADDYIVKRAPVSMLLSRLHAHEILDEVWGDHIRRSLPALSALLRRLRQKMARNGLPDPVENIRGRGFRLLPALRLSTRSELLHSIPSDTTAAKAT